MRGRDPARHRASSAPVVERLGVLLEAGVAPARAWHHVAESLDGPERDRVVAEAVAGALDRGRPGAPALAEALRVPASDRRGRASDGIPRAEWLQLAAAWQVAEWSGAPLAGGLRAFADATRAVTAARRAVDVALSAPRATSRIVLVLPVIGLVIGVALGFDTLHILLGTGVGRACVVGAALLVGLASLWSSRLVTSANPGDEIAGFRLELLAIAIGGGGSWVQARALVEDALTLYASSTSRATGSAIDSTASADNTDIGAIVALSERAGVPAAVLLRSEARERRRDARADAERSAERLGVLLMLPLGVCILPAFLLVGVVPLVLSLLSSTAAGF